MSRDLLHLIDSSVLFTLQDGALVSSLWDLPLSLGTVDLILAEWKSIIIESQIEIGTITAVLFPLASNIY